MKMVDVLRTEDRDEVCDACSTVKVHWRRLGAKLGILPSKIDEIENDNRFDAETCFIKVISTWLSRSRVRNPNAVPTWKSLCEALLYIDRTLAEDIARKHKCNLDYNSELTRTRSESAGATPTTQGAQSLKFSTASSAWKLEQLRNRSGLDGSGIVIAILDTAVDTQYLGKEIEWYDFLQSKPENISTTHGTVCAYIAGGFPSGVAPKADLIVYRVSADGISFDIKAILDALDHIIEKNKQKNDLFIDVISMSFDLNGDDYQVKELRKRIEVLADHGVVLVAAAGNSGNYQSQAAIPAYFEEVISVGALDENGHRSLFNNRGTIDVYAPGENIPMPLAPITQTEVDRSDKGTSYATPAVAGLVALLKQLYARQVDCHLPARKWIRHFKILKLIFQNDMFFKSEDGKADDVFEPFRFFNEKADSLKDIVENYTQCQ